MKKHPIWYLVIGICVLIIPTFIYLCFLVPELSEEYNTLMASGGIISGAGFYGASKIPEKMKYGGLFKTAANSFTILIVVTLIEKFIMKIVGLVVVFIVCFITFKILVEVWENAKRRKRDAEFAKEIARNIAKNS